MENPFRLSFWRNLFTSKDPPNEHIGTYTWTLCYSDPPKNLIWRASPYFYINGVSDCSFNILTRINVSGNLTILIRKNELKMDEELQPCAARIKINIPNYYCQMVKVNEWTDACCSFENIVSLSTMPLCMSCSKARFVRIECEITWFGASDEKESLPLSIRNMDNYFMNSELSDVTLVVNDEEIPAHKVVLASQSEIFSDMLKSVQQQMGNRLVMHNVDIDALKIALKYLYSGDSTALNDVDTLKKVLVISNKYAIAKLMIFCEHKLRESLKIENVVKIIALSKKIRAMSLYDFSLRFISANEDQIVQRDDFKELCLENADILVSLIGLRDTK